MNTQEELFSYINKNAPNGCWLWTGAIGKDGYGRLQWGEKHLKPHRLVYELLQGPIPPGLELDHDPCNNPPCVNPAHLKPVTHRVNVLRGNSIPAQHARQTHCIHGHPLTAENILTPPSGGRKCLTCHRERQKRYRANAVPR